MSRDDYPRSRADQRRERIDLAKTRLANVLRRHVVASMRTLEQKISDAGPNHQRIDPHLLTLAKGEMTAAGALVERRRRSMRWYHLPESSDVEIERRLAELGPIHDRTVAPSFTLRVGQTLEIAIFRELSRQSMLFVGGFPDLDAHDDSLPYSKEEPPKVFSGKSMPGDMRLDFIAIHQTAGPAGVEAKNIREWLYPNRSEVIDLLQKCCSIDAVPVLIARRISYSTFSILHTTGVIVHQTYNQLYPYADADLAALARHKAMLGYHDIRVGNEPDLRLRKFLSTHLPVLIPAARSQFVVYRDLLARYASGELDYPAFAWRVRQRAAGLEEEAPPDDGWEPF